MYVSFVRVENQCLNPGRVLTSKNQGINNVNEKHGRGALDTSLLPTTRLPCFSSCKSIREDVYRKYCSLTRTRLSYKVRRLSIGSQCL